MTVEKTITPGEARAFYDRLGPGLDRMARFEDRARLCLARHGEFGSARRVFEFGCGTGRLAWALLSRFLPADARYLGVDVSPRMVEIAASRLKGLGGRAEVALADGSMRVSAPAAAFDRFVATYVLDLLSREDAASLIEEAHRTLAPGGLVCLAALTHGVDPASRLISSLWGTIQRCAPARVGGCRPISIREALRDGRWLVRHREVVCSLAVPAEVVVAERIGRRAR